jgi:hypothetical protein
MGAKHPTHRIIRASVFPSYRHREGSRIHPALNAEIPQEIEIKISARLSASRFCLESHHNAIRDGRLPQTHGVETHTTSSRPSRAAAATKTRTAARLAPHSSTNRSRSDESCAQQR